MKHTICILGVFFCMLIIVVPVISNPLQSSGSIPENPYFAPFNPDFISYLNETRDAGLARYGESTTALGLVPMTVDLSSIRGARIEYFSSTQSGNERYQSLLSEKMNPVSTSATVTAGELPSGFDLRTMGKVSPVKNQGQCGSCWAFSSFSSLESFLLPEYWDFSENNMRNTHGFDLGSCQGGNSLMATAYLSRWSGALTESSDPYTTISRSATTAQYPNPAAVKHVQQVLFIPGRSGPLDNDNIKRALVEKGALYSTIHWEESAYLPTSASFYYSGSSRANHAITIVGWDDSYARTKFRSLPPGNGAYIVKNTWGTSWGDNGYFHVSYYDSVIGKDNALFTAEDPRTYDRVYQYDPLGWVASYGDNSETAYFANVFTAQSEEDLVAASFYTASPGSTYQLWVYKGVLNTPVTGSPFTSQSGTIEVPGYHTIPFSTPVHLKKGDRFSVVVRLTTPGIRFPVAVEYPISGFSSGARAGTGESYVSSSGTTWTDLSTAFPNANVCLKAFTRSSSGTPAATPTPAPQWTVAPVTPTLTPTPIPPLSDTKPPVVSIISPRMISTVLPGAAVAVTWTASDDRGIAGVDIEYSRDRGQNWETVARALPASGTSTVQVPDDASGIFLIRVTARDTSGNEASATRTCSIRAPFFSGSQVQSVEVEGPDGTIPPSTRQAATIFQDTRAPVIGITDPQPYQGIMAGEVLRVTWTASDNLGVAGVRLSYSPDGGLSWETPARDLPESGSWSLQVPTNASGSFLIRVTARDSSGNEASATRTYMVRSREFQARNVAEHTISGSDTLPHVPVPTQKTHSFTVPTVTPYPFPSRTESFLAR